MLERLKCMFDSPVDIDLLAQNASCKFCVCSYDVCRIDLHPFRKLLCCCIHQQLFRSCICVG